jgi:alpha-1,3/alpha-1,6-mannosyltransferase
MRVAFIHPDLGLGESLSSVYFVNLNTVIGGAERLIVDAALGVQQLGHTVHIYTSHHDPNHCFDETKDGVC